MLVERLRELVEEAARTWSARVLALVQHGDVSLLGMTMHAGEQLLNTKIDPFTLLDQVDQAVSLGTDRIGHALILGIDPEVLVQKGRLDHTRVTEFTTRQREVVDHVRSRGVVIETNLSSNTEISNLTQGEHPAGTFAREGLRVTVNTDDETVLTTTIEREFERVSRARGVTRDDLATMMLEGYRSRMGNRELHQRGCIRTVMLDALVAELTPTEREALASHLAKYFHVSLAGSPRGTISLVIDTVLGI